jgi:predicted MPP superfamily phosphohydrolase
MERKIAVLHLSDMHLSASDLADAEGRSERIAAAINAVAQQPIELLIVITGDLAYSGKAAEYSVVRAFTDELCSRATAIPNVSLAGVALVPGNHDCDFAEDTQARQLVIESLSKSNPALFDGSVVRTLTAIQNEFYTFAELLTKEPIPSDDRVYQHAVFNTSAGQLSLHLLNTASMSRLQEQQGELAFPYGAISKHSGAALEIALMHHPFNWLSANNARLLRTTLESVADIILTGHEHEGGAFERRVAGGGGAVYVEGAVLREARTARSGFNVLVFDSSFVSVRVHEYVWNGEMYAPLRDPIDISLSRHFLPAIGQLRVDPDFLDQFILDPGSPFTHPVKGRLRLDDIYVSPDINERRLGDIARGAKIPSALSEAYCSDADRLVVLGSDDSGKTTLLKRIYRSHLAAGRLPVWLNADELKRGDADYIERALDRAVGHQYGDEAVERFRQAPHQTKAIIIDDFHRARGNTKAHDNIIRHVCGIADFVVLSMDDLYVYERAAEGSEDHPLAPFSAVEIRPFGYQLRGDLIDKWLRLGRELTVSEGDLAYEISRTEHAVNTLMGRSLFPLYPLFVLTVLQTMEAMSNLGTVAVGTYGYVYEALITQKLNSSSATSVDTKYNFLAFVAFSMFARDQRVVSMAEMVEINNAYFDVYRVRLQVESLIAEFSASDLMLTSPNRVWFKYKYVYYYFIARYFAQSLSDPDAELEIRARIEKLAGELYREESANIILFLLYLSKDRRLLDLMFANIDRLYGNVTPALFEGDVAFVGRLNAEKLPLALPDSDADVRRQAVRAKQDSEDDLTSDDQVGELLMLNVSMKSIQILGQVLRNFAGSLPGKLKTRIASEVVKLGLRTLSTIFGIFDSQLPEFRAEMRRFFLESGRANEHTVDEKADRFIFQLIVLFGHAIVRKLSIAIGSEELTETYKDLLAESDTTAMRLIDAAIRLDHFKQIQVADLEALLASLGNNSFAVSLLRDLVWDRLYLFPVDFKIRQRLCAAFGIDDSPRLLNAAVKKIPQ